DRMHTREIAAYGGLVNRMPAYAACFMVFTLANVGLPGTSGFVGEFLTLLGAFKANSWLAIFGTGRRAFGGLCALASPAGDLRRAGKEEPSGDPGPFAARTRHSLAARDHHHRHRRLSETDLRRHRRFGGASRQPAS